MANSCQYRFTFTSDANSDLAVDFSTDGGVSFTPVGNNSYLTMNLGDTLSAVLRGPVGWVFPAGSVVQNIVSRAGNAASKQPYSPFTNGYVYLPVPAANGSATTDSNYTTWTGMVGTVTLNPGQNNKNKFELTVAFAVILAGQTNTEFFADDPEMDIEGSG